VHNYDAQQHRAGQIISPLTLQTITIAQVLYVGGEGVRVSAFFVVLVYWQDFSNKLWMYFLCVKYLEEDSFVAEFKKLL